MNTQSIFNEVKRYNDYYKKNRSTAHLVSFGNSIEHCIEEFKISNPDIYKMYLVCEVSTPKTTKRSSSSIEDSCIEELSKDIQYWNSKK